MSISDFENQVLAMQNAHSFLLTALIRPLLREAGAAGAERIISDLQREFSTLKLPENARTDPETLASISSHYRLAQEMLRQTLEYARPSPSDEE